MAIKKVCKLPTLRRLVSLMEYLFISNTTLGICSLWYYASHPKASHAPGNAFMVYYATLSLLMLFCMSIELRREELSREYIRRFIGLNIVTAFTSIGAFLICSLFAPITPQDTHVAIIIAAYCGIIMLAGSVFLFTEPLFTEPEYSYTPPLAPLRSSIKTVETQPLNTRGVGSRRFMRRARRHENTL
jgi:hypothetical protein